MEPPIEKLSSAHSALLHRTLLSFDAILAFPTRLAEATRGAGAPGCEQKYDTSEPF